MRHPGFTKWILIFVALATLAALTACRIFAPTSDPAPAPTPAAFVSLRTEWRYWAHDTAPAAGWKNVDFDDKQWDVALLPLGTDKTARSRVKLAAPTLYLRTDFTANDPGAYQALFLLLDYQDGAAVYLNGQEIARENLDSKATFGDFADAKHDTPPDRMDVSPAIALLKPGRNILAVQIHRSEADRDLRIGIELQPVTRNGLANFITGPILGRIGPDSITIKAESDIPATVLLEYSVPDGPIGRATLTGTRLPEFTIGELQPGTRYTYRVGLQTSGGITWSPTGQWTTDPGENQGFRFMVWGDNRPRTGSSEPPVFEQLLEQAQRAQPLALAMSVGDNVQLAVGATDEATVRNRYIDFLQAVGPLARQTPLYSVLGNHDGPDCETCVDGFRRYLVQPRQNDQTYYSFDYGAAHFVVLNSQENHGGTVNAISDDQWKWLQADLGKKTRPLKFVFLHNSIFHEAKEQDYQSFSPSEQERLHDLFRRSGVTGVFAGHSHYYDYYERDHIPYIITGGGGSPLYDQYVNPNWGKYHLLIVDVNREQVVVEAKLPDGTSLDRRSINVR